MSRQPVIITPNYIRRHNWRCLGRIALSILGASAVFLVVFVFAWLLSSIVTRSRDLEPPAIIFASVFSFAVFAWGHWHLKVKGPQDWEKIAQKPYRKAGMRLGSLSNQDYGQIGQGFLALILAGPGWMQKIVDDWSVRMPATEEFADRMESARRHFAAREAWVPMKDFEAHETDIYLLTRLNIVAIRELQGQYCFRVTVEGSVVRDTPEKIEA